MRAPLRTISIVLWAVTRRLRRSLSPYARGRRSTPGGWRAGGRSHSAKAREQVDLLLGQFVHFPIQLLRYVDLFLGAVGNLTDSSGVALNLYRHGRLLFGGGSNLVRHLVDGVHRMGDSA